MAQKNDDLDPAKEPEVQTAEEAEMEARRGRVLAMHLRKLTQPAIAAIIGVSQATISRDLQWIYANWRHLYGWPVGLNVAEFIGETLAMYSDHEQQSLLEVQELKMAAQNRRISPMFISRARSAARRTAMAARMAQVQLLQDLGHVERQVGSLDVTHRVAKAEDIRRLLREEGLQLAEGRQKTVPVDPAEAVEGEIIAKWLQGESDTPQ